MIKKSVLRKTVVKYLDDLLHISEIKDDSLNGLQVEGGSRVSRIAFAVDGCLQTIKAAAKMRADMLVVHHGLLWGKNQPIRGILHKRVSILLAKNISLYAAHLPLDCHESVGNNAEIARLLGMQPVEKFAMYHGTEIGLIAAPEQPVPRRRIVKQVEGALRTSVDVLSFGSNRVKKVGIVSGDAGYLTAEALVKGCDTIITGETSHVLYHFAKEGKLNVLYAGHYASETVGLKALARNLRKHYSLECKFIPAPTGY